MVDYFVLTILLLWHKQIAYSLERETKMAQNTLKEECSSCHTIYLTNMVELKKTWVSLCPTCKTSGRNEWANVLNGAYAERVGN